MTLDSFSNFWNLVIDVWRNGVYGIDISRILIAIGIFLIFLLLRRLFSRYVMHRIRRWSAKTETKLDDQVAKALEQPFTFIPIVVGLFIATQYLNPEGNLAFFLANLNRSLVAFTIFWSLYRVVEPLSTVSTQLSEMFGPSLVDWLTKTLKVTFTILGGAAILEIWGIEVGPVIAGLGLFGVAVALGAQDLFKNLIAGIFVIGERRFQPGDWVFVDGVVEGTVEEIGFRTTRIRRFDKSPVYVPNAKLSDNAVTNFSQMSHRRIYWMIGVEYRTTTEQLRMICDGIVTYISNNDDFAKPGETPLFVNVDKFADSSIDIMVYCFTKTIKWGEWLEIKEKLAFEIKRIVESAGTGFAFPSRSVYLESLPAAVGDKPEIFSPPTAAE